MAAVNAKESLLTLAACDGKTCAAAVRVKELLLALEAPASNTPVGAVRFRESDETDAPCANGIAVAAVRVREQPLVLLAPASGIVVAPPVVGRRSVRRVISRYARGRARPVANVDATDVLHSTVLVELLPVPSAK